MGDVAPPDSPLWTCLLFRSVLTHMQSSLCFPRSGEMLPQLRILQHCTLNPIFPLSIPQHNSLFTSLCFPSDCRLLKASCRLFFMLHLVYRLVLASTQQVYCMNEAVVTPTTGLFFYCYILLLLPHKKNFYMPNYGNLYAF